LLEVFWFSIAPVPSQKAQKIDLNTEYPCPCRRRGSLVPITLTEAFGCNRCQQIFVVEESGYVIEQLSTSYPYKKAWRWTGHRWNTAHSSLGESYLPVALGIVLLLLIVWLPLALNYAPKPIVVWLLVPLLLMGFLGLWTWLAYRR
jgi:hypothetical protein